MQMNELNQAITNLDIPKYNLDTCSMLVEFSAPMWTARKLDKNTTEEVRQTKEAKAKGAARVTKNMLAGTSELDNILSFVQTVRKYVAYMTLPWADRGARLLPTAKFIEFDTQMKEYEQQFILKVNDFLQIYPTLITAQAMALGKMFNRAEFPDVKDIARKFAFHVTYTPLPTSGDFRIDVGTAAQEELKARLNEVYSRRIGDAVDEVRERLSEAIKHLADQLTVDYVGKEAKPRRFYKSTLEAAQNLCDIVPALNVANDQRLEEVRAELERIIGGIGVETIRDDYPAREEIKKEMDDLASRLDF